MTGADLARSYIWKADTRVKKRIHRGDAEYAEKKFYMKYF